MEEQLGDVRSVHTVPFKRAMLWPALSALLVAGSVGLIGVIGRVPLWLLLAGVTGVGTLTFFLLGFEALKERTTQVRLHWNGVIVERSRGSVFALFDEVDRIYMPVDVQSGVVGSVAALHKLRLVGRDGRRVDVPLLGVMRVPDFT
jgi:hypothetical protein